jgi:hypothetical protein
MDQMSIGLEGLLATSSAPISMPRFLIALIFTSITAFFLRKVYIRFGIALSNRKSFSNMFIPLALITMIIITIVKSSLALSLGLVGALSIVRFRSAIKEPEELIYLFMCIALGLGFGADQVSVTTVGFVFFTAAVAIFRNNKIGATESNVMYLTISNRGKQRLQLDEMLDIINRSAFEVDLKRLDEGTAHNEVSFVTSFKDVNQLIGLRNALIDFDENIEIVFLDNSKVF